MEKRRSLGEQIFSPTIFLMDRLPYLAKFSIIGLFLAVPLGILSFINISTLNEQVVFNWQIHTGIEYVNPLKKFLHEVQRHRVLTVATLAGAGNYDPALASARAEADRLAGEVTALDGTIAPRYSESYGSLLKTTDYWKKINEQWNGLKDKRFAGPVEADAAYETLTASVADLILNYVANYSNLILDPDLDSYWLMDALVAKLPLITQTVSKSTTLSLIRADEVKAQDRILDLAGYYKTALGTVTDLRDVNMATSFKETINPNNPNRGDKFDLKSNLEEPLKKTVEKVNAHGNDVVKAAFIATGPMSAAQARAATQQALETLDQLHTFWDKLSPELDWITKKRAEQKYGKRKLVSQVLVGAIVVMITLLFVGFYMSVRRAVGSIADAAVRMIEGTTETFVAESRDELGEVLERYNQINQALVESRSLRDKIEGDNRELQANIMDMLQVVSQASEGDLTVKAQVTAGALGNVADAFNELLASLQRLIGEIKSQQLQTNDVVAQIRTASQNMAQGATSQAKEILAASQFVERMSSEIERVSGNAKNAAEAAKRTESSAVEGSKAVDDVITGMEQLRANVQAGAKKIKTLGDRSMEISSIVNVINRISEQTNMLALNAAIEAARAGEHGRGFSVVAEEVRKLAERTAQATQDIERLVKAIQVETTETVSAIEVQTNVVEKESAIVGQAGTSLVRIREVSSTSAGLVTEISTVAQQQVEGTRSVVKVMGQISSIAQQTQVGAQSTVAGMAELAKVQEQLAKSIRRFKLNS